MAGSGVNLVQKGNQILRILGASKSFDRVLDKVKMVSCGDGRCVCEMTVSEEHLNRGGTLHGGFTATTIDIISTFALVSHTERGTGGVSINLAIQYMKAARPGDEIVFDASTLKTSQNLAFLTVDIKNKNTGLLLAQGQHTKALMTPNPKALKELFAGWH